MLSSISFPLAASFRFWKKKKVVERIVVEQSRFGRNAWWLLLEAAREG
jgi:hypothetical protein